MQKPSLPSYQAPSNLEAHDAYNVRIEQYALETSGSIFEAAPADTSADWAIDFQLDECVWGRETTMTRTAIGLRDNSGYFCRFRVQPLESVDYSTIGFFTHDGSRWRFFGRTKFSDAGLAAQLSRDRAVRSQPFVNSPYLDGEIYNYDYSDGILIDNTPYTGASEGFYRLDPDSTKYGGSSDRVITTYERDDYRRRRDMEDYVKYPKGTKERNATGY